MGGRVSRPKGIPSHRKGLSIEKEYGNEKAKRIRNKLSFKTKEQHKKNGAYWFGKHRDEKTRLKISEKNKGKQKYRMTDDIRKKMSLSKTGEKIFSFFRSSLQSRVRRSQKYKEWRLLVFAKDDFTCQECGKKGVWIEAHHITPFSIILKYNYINSYEKAMTCEQLWDINNGITYCNTCHSKKDEFRAKFNNGVR